LQATRNPREVLHHLVRIGRHAIVSIPNFAHWRMRMRLFVEGRMPRTPSLPYRWYDTPNIHLCTIADFAALAGEMGAVTERALALSEEGHTHPMSTDAWGPNLFAESAIFLLHAGAPRPPNS
jgi:methionine biosynthesis protein MetW